MGIALATVRAVLRCLTAVASNPSASKIATLRVAMVGISAGNSSWLRAFVLSKVVFVGAIEGLVGSRGPPTILETVAAREGLIS